MQIGNEVIVIDGGGNFSRHEAMAKKLGATKWQYGASVPNETKGTIVNFKLQQYPISPYGKYWVLIDCGAREFIINNKCLKIITDWDE